MALLAIGVCAVVLCIVIIRSMPTPTGPGTAGSDANEQLRKSPQGAQQSENSGAIHEKKTPAIEHDDLPTVAEAPSENPQISRIRVTDESPTPLLKDRSFGDDNKVIARIPKDTKLEVLEWADEPSGEVLIRFFKVEYAEKVGWVNQHYTDGTLYLESAGKTTTEDIPGKNGFRKAPLSAEVMKKKEKVKNQFSAWDGSHIEFVRAIKASMKNPDSFEHVKTNYWEYSDHTIVKCTFRGTNSFGAVETVTYRATVSLDGKILELGQ